MKLLLKTALSLIVFFLLVTNLSAQDSFKTITQKGLSEMTSMTMTGDPDNDYAMMTRQHHLNGIEMINYELANGKNSSLKELATKMKMDQQKDNAEFNNFLNHHKPHTKSNFGETTMKMMKNKGPMNAILQRDIDKDFATLMIEHHKDGIKTSEEYLKAAKDPKLKKIASTIIRKQRADIEKLKAFAGTN